MFVDKRLRGSCAGQNRTPGDSVEQITIMRKTDVFFPCSSVVTSAAVLAGGLSGELVRRLSMLRAKDKEETIIWRNNEKWPSEDVPCGP